MTDVQTVFPASSSSNALTATLSQYWKAFTDRREALGLSNPGIVEDVAKETQRGVFLNNFMITGLRADLTKTFSATPMFQVAHAFSQGAGQGMPPYTFLASFGTPKVSSAYAIMSIKKDELTRPY